MFTAHPFQTLIETWVNDFLHIIYIAVYLEENYGILANRKQSRMETVKIQQNDLAVFRCCQETRVFMHKSLTKNQVNFSSSSVEVYECVCPPYRQPLVSVNFSMLLNETFRYLLIQA